MAGLRRKTTDATIINNMAKALKDTGRDVAVIATSMAVMRVSNPISDQTRTYLKKHRCSNGQGQKDESPCVVSGLSHPFRMVTPETTLPV